MQNRTCYICKEEQPLEKFYKTKLKKLGRSYECKECSKASKRKSPEEVAKSYEKRDERLRELGKKSRGKTLTVEHRRKMALTKSKLRSQKARNVSRARLIWSLYKTRGFDRSFEEFFAITQKDCHYCGVERSNISTGKPDPRCKFISKVGTFIYNGIDRQDNGLGYVEGNMVPCCDICNKAKRDLPLAIFEAWMDKIAQKRKV